MRSCSFAAFAAAFLLSPSASDAFVIPAAASPGAAVINRGGAAVRPSPIVLKDAIRETTTTVVVESDTKPPLDVNAVGKYVVGMAVQSGLIYGALMGVDAAIAKFVSGGMSKIPLWAHFIFLYGFNAKTSIFSILPSKGDNNTEGWEYQNRNRPGWTPPGWVFGVMWPLFVFGMRAYTAARIVQNLGCYASSTLMALMFHLQFGNLWNTINNVEHRLGVSVLALYGLVATKAFAAYQFFQVDEMAGKLLALTLTWITAAAALETHTWRLNPDPDTARVEPLYPAKGKWRTLFRWES